MPPAAVAAPSIRSAMRSVLGGAGPGRVGRLRMVWRGRTTSGALTTIRRPVVGVRCWGCEHETFPTMIERGFQSRRQTLQIAR